jgi:hypothetical protein
MEKKKKYSFVGQHGMVQPGDMAHHGATWPGTTVGGSVMHHDDMGMVGWLMCGLGHGG